MKGRGVDPLLKKNGWGVGGTSPPGKMQNRLPSGRIKRVPAEKSPAASNFFYASGLERLYVFGGCRQGGGTPPTNMQVGEVDPLFKIKWWGGRGYLPPRQNAKPASVRAGQTSTDRKISDVG